MRPTPVPLLSPLEGRISEDTRTLTRGVLLGATISILAAACSDVTRQVEPRQTVPSETAQWDARVIRDWFTCVSWDGGATFVCEYDGSDGFDFYNFDIPSGHISVLSTKDCATDPSGCPTGGAAFAQLPPAQEFDIDWGGLPPDCNATLTKEGHKKWCSGELPSGTRLTRIKAALASMRTIGGVCTTLANIGDSLLVHKTLKIAKPAPADSGSGWAPIGGGAQGSNSWMAISTVWTDVFYDSTHYTTNEVVHRNLQRTLAHELDHLNGSIHFASPYQTPNSEACSLVP